MIRKYCPPLVPAAVLGGWVGASLTQQWRLVSVLGSDVSGGVTSLAVEANKPIEVGRLILLEARDGGYRETCGVRHVYGTTVILEERLQRDFVAGSRIYQ